jgi:hypothetical protein
MSIGAVREPSVHPFPVSSTPATPAAEPEGSTPSTSDVPSVFATVLSGIGREVQHGESLVRSALGAARRGIEGTMGPAELIALQAGVYRYGEAVDLASRLVDRATTSVKTVLQGQ